MKHVFTVANILTAMRLVLAFPLIYLLGTGERSVSILILFGVAALTDLFDGYFARKRNEETALGQVLDPVADKVLVVGTLLALVVSGTIPPLWFLVLAAKELTMVVGGALLLGKARSVIKARLLGKVATAVLLIGLFLVLLSFEQLGRTAIGIGILISLAAGIDYLIVILRFRAEKGQLLE